MIEILIDSRQYEYTDILDFTSSKIDTASCTDHKFTGVSTYYLIIQVIWLLCTQIWFMLGAFHISKSLCQQRYPVEVIRFWK